LKKPAGKGGRKHLDDDEAALWEHAAQSIDPLKRKKSRVHPAAERIAKDADEIPARSRQSSKAAAPMSSKAGQARADVKPAPAKPVPPIASFDPKKARKLRSGQVDIEARIDLHGMRQDEAHTALRGFLTRCLSKGQRWVLVITGKGKAAAREDDDGGFFTARGSGVLKRNVPRWLEEPDLRGMVVSYTTAAIQHGGDGALYVHLRTKQR
jgi:DNA-nicking Smr family endonuclease